MFLPQLISETFVGEDATILDFILIIGHILLDCRYNDRAIAKAGGKRRGVLSENEQLMGNW